MKKSPPIKRKKTRRQELLEASKNHGGKSIALFTNKELVARAKGNHTWLNGFSCINPSKEFCEEVGRMIIQQVMHSDMRDQWGISRMEIFTINAS